ncbi:MAG: hypothetical protein K0U36_04540 [Alphaproteobacteria bacterium]|nr:hypothetical protein [Alphaproteobacteria bacterium]
MTILTTPSAPTSPPPGMTSSRQRQKMLVRALGALPAAVTGDTNGSVSSSVTAARAGHPAGQGSNNKSPKKAATHSLFGALLLLVAGVGGVGGVGGVLGVPSLGQADHHFALTIVRAGEGYRFGYQFMAETCTVINRAANEQTTLQETTGHRCLAVSSTDPVQDLQLLRRRLVDFLVLRGDLAHAAYYGNDAFVTPYPELRVIAALPAVPLRIASRPGVRIARLRDMLGLRVAFGGPRSEERLLMNLVRRERGWHASDFAWDLVAPPERSMQALCNNEIDVMIVFAWDWVPSCPFNRGRLAESELQAIVVAHPEYVRYEPRVFSVADLAQFSGSENQSGDQPANESDGVRADAAEEQTTTVQTLQSAGVVGATTIALRYLLLSHGATDNASNQAGRQRMIDAIVTSQHPDYQGDAITLRRTDEWAPLFRAVRCAFCWQISLFRLLDSGVPIPFDPHSRAYLQDAFAE